MYMLARHLISTADKSVPLGRISVTSLSELRPLDATQSHSHSTNKPSLWDLEPEPGIYMYVDSSVLPIQTCISSVHNFHHWLCDVGKSFSDMHSFLA